jgi:hypothetical protein
MKESMQKRVVILATDHTSQIGGLDAERNQGLKLRLAWLKSKFDWQIALEEWSDKHDHSVAREFANAAGLQWHNVGTPDEEQFKTFNGPINYPENDGTIQPVDWHAPSMYEYGPFENQEARENRMADNISAKMEVYEVALYIVGLAHLHSMFLKLHSRGIVVTAYFWV